MSRASENPEEFGGEGLALFYYNIKTPKEKTPYFEVTKAVDGKRTPCDNDKGISGHLVKVERSDWQPEGKEIQKAFKLHLKDLETKEFYIVGCNMTNVGRSIINTLAGVDGNIDKVSISLYVNKKGYSSVYVLIDGKEVGWKYSVEDLNKGVKAYKDDDGNIIKRDYGQLNERMLENVLLKEVAGKIVELPKAEITNEENDLEATADQENLRILLAKTNAEPAEDEIGQETGDDLPF